MTETTDWDRREVCADGNCIGVIGPDGLCKVCGRALPGFGGAYRESPTGEREDDADDDDAEDDAEDGDAMAAEPEHGVDDPDWSRRRLCSDGACVGVIGADGTCSVCGSAA